MKMQKILQEIQKYEYFAQHDKVLVAVSGGVDSMNLLLFLQAHQEDLAIQIGLAHVNHKQRQESEIEEAYLRKWAQDHQVPFYLAHFSGNFSEKTAREFRYDFFKRVMEEE
ncbi:ATP-binding protein, partial [Streptococcus sobrinus]